jgi:hypothetical protein
MEQLMSYLVTQGPWAVIAGGACWLLYKLGGKVLNALDRNTAAIARVESVMDRVLEKLDV